MAWPLGWTILPPLFPGGDCYTYAISADGSTVLGEADDADGNGYACYWTEAGIVNLGRLPGGDYSFANSASADGSVITGFSTIADGSGRAWRWTAADGMQDITSALYPGASSGNTITYDGVTIAGFLTDLTTFHTQSYIWTEDDGITLLPLPSGVTDTRDGEISPDGQYVTGYISSTSTFNIFTWTASDGSVDTGIPTPGYDTGSSTSFPQINNDGIIWITGARAGVGNEGVRLWKIVDNVLSEFNIGLLPGGAFATGQSVTKDGGVIAGQAGNAAGEVVAFWWTATTGMVEIAAPAGYYNPETTFDSGLSADGLTFSGMAKDTVSNVRFATVYRIGTSPTPPAKLALDDVLVTGTDASFDLVYRWRSRQFYLASPVSLGACQVSLNKQVLNFPPGAASVPPLSDGDPVMILPAGVNAVFNLYVGPKGRTLYMSKVLDQPRMIFRLPSGLKAFNWQFEIISRVPVHSVELASTMRELKGV